MSMASSKFALSLSQKDIYLDQLHRDDSPLYNIGGYIMCRGIDIDRMTRAHRRLVLSHDVFGIRIGVEAGEPYQTISRQRDSALPIIDFSHHDSPTDAAKAWFRDVLDTPVEFEHRQLCHARLLKLGDDSFWYAHYAHHLVIDGWGYVNWAKALADYYQQDVSTEPEDTDGAEWQARVASDMQYVQSARFLSDKDYWLDHLDKRPTLPLQPLHASQFAGQQPIPSRRHVQPLKRELFDRLTTFAAQLGCGVPQVFMAMLAVYFGKVCGQDTLCIGVPAHNRRNHREKAMIGVFTGISPQLVKIDDECHFTDLIEQIQRTQKAAFRHQRYPLGQLTRDLAQTTQQPLFDLVFNYLKLDYSGVAFAGNPTEVIYVSNNYQPTPLAVNIWDGESEAIELQLDYNQAYFNETEIQWLAGRFEYLLEQLCAQPNLPLAQVRLTAPKEAQFLLNRINDTKVEYDQSICIHRLTEAQVAATPDTIACVFDDDGQQKQLTFAQLNGRANQLAAYLIDQRQVTADTIVGLCLERSLDMVVAILAVLKAGGAYLPLDPDLPPERLAYMSKDAKLTTVLTHETLQPSIADLPVVCLDCKALVQQLEQYSAVNHVQNSLVADNLAYVIYTSGSTGRPKGVMVSHKALHNRIDWMHKQYGATGSDAILQKTPFSFDVSVWEFVWPLVTGAKLVLARPDGHKDPHYLQSVIERQQITKCHFVPSMLSVMLKAGGFERCTSLKQVFCSGEALPLSHVQAFKQQLSATQLHNLYGPTEAAIDVSYHDCANVTVAGVPIGKPIQNTRLLILDSQQQLAPLGTVGELYIGGDGLARGYLNRPEMTAQKFIDDPFVASSTAQRQRLYSTGDLARWAFNESNGTPELMYCGRVDHQVKIRGQRIELGEIEQALNDATGVEESTVMARNNEAGEPVLVAYLVAKGLSDESGVEPLKRQLFITLLNEHLKQSLADYMIPAAYVLMAALPVTGNGKVDRKNLPAPDMSLMQKTYVAPRNEVEQWLAEAWQQVLGLDRVGVNDNFFALGGHSLMIAQLISRLQKQGIKLTVRQCFAAESLAGLAEAVQAENHLVTADFDVVENLIEQGCSSITPSMLPLLNIAQRDIDQIVRQVPQGVAAIADIYPLGPLQEGILFHHLVNQESDPYVLNAVFSMDKQEVVDQFIGALNLVVARHDTLRTAIVWEGLSQPVQVVYRHAHVAVTHVEMSPEQDGLAYLESLCSGCGQRMDLTQPALLKVHVVERENGGKYLLLQLHHIISDHVGLEIILQELSLCLLGQQDSLTPPRPYREFIAHVGYIAKQTDAETFFSAMLADVDRPTAPFELFDVLGDGSQAVEARGDLPQPLCVKLRAVAKTLMVSPAAIFHAAYAMVVASCAANQDVVFGTVVSGRLQGAKGAENMLGVFINTLPLRVNLAGQSVLQFLSRVQEDLHALLPFEQTPLALAQQCSGLSGDSPLFTAMLNYRHSQPKALFSAHPGIDFVQSRERTNYPFALSVDDLGDAFALEAQTEATVDAQRLIDYMLQALSGVVEAIASGGQRQVSEISVLPPHEQKELLDNSTRTSAFADDGRGIHQWFEQQVAAYPDKVAVQYGAAADGQQLTYQALNQRANQLAHYLVVQGDVKPDSLVGLCFERSLDMAVAILAVLKAGGGYVPLDPVLPAARLQFMIEDAGLQSMVSTSKLAQSVLTDQHNVICLDALALESLPDDNMEIDGLTSSNLAYVIYTSGSTGKPKGVMVEHRNVTRLFQTTEAQFRFDHTDSWTLFHSFAFDFSVWEFWGALAHGGKLVMVPYWLSRDPGKFIGFLSEEQITILNQTPSAFYQLISAGACDESVDLSLRQVIFGGEALNLEALQPWVERFGDSKPQLVNMYGITETTVHVTYKRIVATDIAAGGSPIGERLADLDLLLLDQSLQLVPKGVSGEMYVGGAGVARGYLNRRELTAERFIELPGLAGQRFYRSGDLACMHADKGLVYQGRIDQQVKVRGFRIELGEIEQILCQHDAVKEAIVMAQAGPGGEQQLIGFVVADAPQLANELRQYLGQRLADYMVPSHIGVLKQLPLTGNGKIDKRALAQLQPDLPANDYVAPQNRTQQVLCQSVQAVLGLERVGITDNFFALGGHSLLATRLVTQINQALGVQLALRTLFEHPRLTELAEHLDQLRSDAVHQTIMPVRGKARLQPSFAQQRMWLLAQIDSHNSQYNVVGGLKLVGGLDRPALQSALDALVARHESLRTVFMQNEQGELEQQIVPPSSIPLPSNDLTELTESAQKTSIDHAVDEHEQKAFDLAFDTLLRASLHKIAGDEHLLIVSIHHIACDGWSLAILVKELGCLYGQFVEAGAPQLSPLTIQYADYAAWQRGWLSAQVLDEQLAYWQQQLADLPVLHSLPLDKPRPEIQSYIGGACRREIQSAVARQFNLLCQRQGATLFMGLHAAFAVLLSRHSNQADIVIGSPIANREQNEVAELIGLFANTLVLRSDVSGQPGFSQLLAQSKNTLLDAYAHQQVPFEQLVETLQPQRSLSHSPLFQVMLVLQNNAEVVAKFSGLNVAVVDIQRQLSKYDLNLEVIESESGLKLNWQYNSDLFKAATIERMAEQFEVLLGAIVAEPTRNVFELALLGTFQQNRQLLAWNDTARAFDEASCIHQLFETHAANQPQTVAVMAGGAQLSFGELNARANQLARYLRQYRDIGPDKVVGICLGRDVQMVVAMLAVVKAGGAFVPLDPDYPAVRLAYMLDDAKVDTVISIDGLVAATGIDASLAVCLDSAELITHLDALAQGNIGPQASGAKADNLAYVIYTSGSTGNPKGVMVEHRSLVNYATAIARKCEHVEQGYVNTNICFDGTATSFWVPLLMGKGIELSSSSTADSLGELIDKLNQSEQPTLFKITPAHLDALIQGNCKPKPGIRHVMFVGGETLFTRKFQALGQAFDDVAVFNHYGPSEATVGCATFAINSQQLPQGLSVPLGKPIDNTTLLVFNEHMQLCPPGVAGQLYIGGAGLARGYLHRDELTAQQFIRNPYHGEGSCERLYQTGDIVRWLEDGNLEFLGRADHQVKIRGFRIELAEIEHHVCSFGPVQDAVVIVHPHSEQLIAYLTTSDADDAQRNALLVKQLRQHLEQCLPGYMVPGAFAVMAALPLTGNGKVDRKALPEPDITLVQNVFVAPHSPLEHLLCDIWRQVLGVAQVGCNDNFFSLGGHSLLVMQVISALQKQGIGMSAKTLFANPTVARLALVLEDEGQTGDLDHQVPHNHIEPGCTRVTPAMLPLVDLEQQHIDQITTLVPGGVGNIQDIYPLGPLQEGILFHHMMSNHGDPYISPFMFAVHSGDALERFVAALQQIVDRHDVLRSAVMWQGLPVPVQVVCRKVKLDVQKVEQAPGQSAEQKLAQLCLPENQTMDLTQGGLLRVRIAEQGSDEHLVLLQLHHIISDHVGLEIIEQELNLLLQSKEAELPAPVPYRTFIAHTLHRKTQIDPETFFTEQLGDIDEPTAPFELMDVKGDGSLVVEARATVPQDTSRVLRQLAKDLEVSPAALFHAAWAMVVGACSGRDDVVFGTVMSGRLQGVSGSQSIMGVFINTLPLRVKLAGVNAIELVSQVQNSLHELLPYEQAPLSIAQGCTELAGDLPLFSAILNYRHSHVPNVTCDGQPPKEVELLSAQERTNYPFILSVDDYSDDFALDVQVDNSVDPQTVAGFVLQAIEQLVENVAAMKATPVTAMTVLSAASRKQLLDLSSSKLGGENSNKTIVELFESKAAQVPHNIAVICEGLQHDYADLNRKANQLAHYLRNDCAVLPGSTVGLCLERNTNAIIAMLAILKAGCAYVPLDAAFPAKRLAVMLDDTRPACVVMGSDFQALLVDTAIAAICLDAVDVQHGINRQSAENLPSLAGPEDVANIIYTSGSSGKPKGVMVPHRGVSSLVADNRVAALSGDTVMLQNSSISFDAATFEIWGALLNGGRLVMQPQALLDIQSLNRFIGEHGINTAWMTAGLFDQFAPVYNPLVGRLQQLIVGGDIVKTHSVAQIRISDPNLVLVNGYGPTESTTFTTCFTIPQDIGSFEHIPIGKPLHNRTVLVLNEHQQLVPKGACGELCITGAGLAKGYLNQTELSDEKFVANPFYQDGQPECYRRLYRSGDLVRWAKHHDDYQIEFMGRIDQQVKIRGFRIEPEDIENNLYAHSDVIDAVVVVRKDYSGDKHLVAYVVSHPHLLADLVASQVFVEQLKLQLSQDLPDYMVPHAFVLLEQLPLTVNGKVDYKALPAPQLEGQSGQYIAPVSPAEQALCHCWQQLFGLQQISIDDNFFALGGNSLLAMKLLVLLKSDHDIELPINMVFQMPQLQSLAAYIEVSHPAFRTDNNNELSADADEMESFQI